jgi:hypothetical protein
MTPKQNPRELSRAIERVWDLYDAPTNSATVEPGFESADLGAGDVQLRKACRSLQLVRQLVVDKNSGVYHVRYYSNAIEASFHVIERTCNAGLIYVEKIEEGTSPSDHGFSYENSHFLAIWDQAQAQEFKALHDAFRSKNYYRAGEGTVERALAMYELAKTVHGLVVEAMPKAKEACICQ